MAGTLGTGCVEKEYENALTPELRGRGTKLEQPRGIAVFRHGTMIENPVAEILIEEDMIAKTKQNKMINPGHPARYRNDRKSSSSRL